MTMEQTGLPKGYVSFDVLGEPSGKGRPKFTTIQGHARAITPKATVTYENLIRVEYRRQCGTKRFDDDAMIGMKVTAYYSIPKSVSKKKRDEMINGIIRPTKKPDYDNIAKVVSDALNEVAYRDDKNIVDCVVQKFYSEKPRLEIQLWDASCSRLKIKLM